MNHHDNQYAGPRDRRVPVGGARANPAGFTYGLAWIRV